MYQLQSQKCYYLSNSINSNQLINSMDQYHESNSHLNSILSILINVLNLECLQSNYYSNLIFPINQVSVHQSQQSYFHSNPIISNFQTSAILTN